MTWRDARVLGGFLAVFLAAYFLPVESARFSGAVIEAFALLKWYAREHVLLCLIPAFFIAGAIAAFVSQAAVLRYLGARANKVLAYGVASVSGSLLAVCSCTVLPLFAGIHKRGAGLGPATAFLYAGPGINVLAIILTARVLGVELGVARAVGAIGFSVVIGLAMHLIFRREEEARAAAPAVLPDDESPRPLAQTAVVFAALVGVLVFANWGAPAGGAGFWAAVASAKWILTAGFGLVLAAALAAWYGASRAGLAVTALATAAAALLAPGHPELAFTVGVLGFTLTAARDRGELHEWLDQTWWFTKLILPLLLAGILVAGFLLGRPGHEGVIPSEWVARLVGGNSLGANLFAAVAGAFMYFATLTEVPILQGLLGAGMGKGPALALLLAGPALSLPNMLVIRGVIGTRQTAVYVALVVAMSTVSGLIFGALY